MTSDLTLELFGTKALGSDFIRACIGLGRAVKDPILLTWKIDPEIDSGNLELSFWATDLPERYRPGAVAAVRRLDPEMAKQADPGTIVEVFINLIQNEMMVAEHAGLLDKEGWRES